MRAANFVYGSSIHTGSSWSHPDVKEEDWIAAIVTDQYNGNMQTTNVTLRNVEYINYYFVNEELNVQKNAVFINSYSYRL